MHNEAEDPRDEQLLQWALDPEGLDQDARALLESDKAALLERTELADFLADCRASLSDDSVIASSLDQGRTDSSTAQDGRDLLSLRERVFSETTREDLSWSGDLRLLRGYFGERMRSNGLLKFAAASLLVHLMALPVAAYYGLFSPAREDGIIVNLGSPPVDPDELPIEPEYEVDFGSSEGLFLDRLGSKPGESNAVYLTKLWAKSNLAEGGAPQQVADEDARRDLGPIARLLDARSRLINQGDRGLSLLRSEAGPLERALWVELSLDRYLLTERQPLGGFAKAVDDLRGELFAPADSAADPAARTWPLASAAGRPELAIRLLQLSALARAQAYGLLSAEQSAGLDEAWISFESGAFAERAALLKEPLRVAAPLDPTWTKTLGEALAGHASVHAPGASTVAAWLAWEH